MLNNDPNFKVSENFPNPFDGIDLNNFKLMKTYKYDDLMGDYIYSQVVNTEGYSDTLNSFIRYQEYLAQSDLAPEIRDRLGLMHSEVGFTYAKDKQKYYDTYS